MPPLPPIGALGGGCNHFGQLELSGVFLYQASPLHMPQYPRHLFWPFGVAKTGGGQCLGQSPYIHIYGICTHTNIGGGSGCGQPFFLAVDQEWRVSFSHMLTSLSHRVPIPKANTLGVLFPIFSSNLAVGWQEVSFAIV